MIKLELLRAFAVVARRGNLKDAADELGRTQSAVSMSLAHLEDLLGGPLFETDRKANLTVLGRYVRNRADELLRDNDRVQEQIFDFAKGNAGRLRIASVPSVAVLILPNLLQDFRADHPDAHIELTDSDSTNVRSMVDRGQADIGIAGPAASGQSLHQKLLFEDRFHAVCHAQSPLSRKAGPLHWSDLDGQALIANETLMNIRSSDARNLVLQSRLSARNVSSLFAMVRSGLGYTILPGLATRNLTHPLTSIEMKGEDCERQISLLKRSGRSLSPLAGAFEAFLLRRMPDIASNFSLSVSPT